MNERESAAIRILRDALELNADERAHWVDSRCQGDSGLRARVDSLLRHALDIENEPDVPESHRRDIDDADGLPGTRLGPYRVIERIGRGGMGVVYRGEREGADFTQTVALKLIRRGFDFDDVQMRFLRERRILARLAHPNIARFIDGGVAPDGRPWFALEFVHGETITRWCDARRLGIRARVSLLLEVCAAVQYAHTQLIVHRDLKPGNILVDPGGAARLLDFGIARLLDGDERNDATVTMAGASYALTPEYAAPEQFIGAAVGVGADVYALGVILYELIAGIGPYAVDRLDMAASVRDTPPESLLTAIGNPRSQTSTAMLGVDPQSILAARLDSRGLSAHAYRSTVRGDLTRILGKALAKETERRYATVDAFAGDLARWLAREPVQISGNGFGYRMGKFIGRNRVAVAVAGALAFGLMATSVLALRSATQERQQREAAVAETARATAVRDYVQLMFRSVAEQPDSARTTARDALQRGAEQIFVQFKDQPEIGQSTALSLSELYMQLGDANGGAALLERLLAWPGIENNPDVLAIARYNLAQLEYARGEKTHARALLDKAQAWWNTEPARHHDMLMESRTAQAQIERAEGRVEQAIATLEAAIVERKNMRPMDVREVASALNAMSLALTEVGRYGEAVQRAGEGYDLLAKAGLESDVAALALLNNRANALVTMGRPDTAVADFRRVADARRELYGHSPELANSQANLALALVAQSRSLAGDARQSVIDEAVVLLEESYAMAIEGSGENGRSAAFIRSNLADVYVLAGAYEKAEPMAEAAVRIGTKQFGATSQLAGLGLRARARLRAAQGRNAEARADVAAAKSIFGAMGKGGERYVESLDPILDGLGVN